MGGIIDLDIGDNAKKLLGTKGLRDKHFEVKLGSDSNGFIFMDDDAWKGLNCYENTSIANDNMTGNN